jgi:ABC-type phosphate transport system permease subunit
MKMPRINDYKSQKYLPMKTKSGDVGYVATLALCLPASAISVIYVIPLANLAAIFVSMERRVGLFPDGVKGISISSLT